MSRLIAWVELVLVLQVWLTAGLAWLLRKPLRGIWRHFVWGPLLVIGDRQDRRYRQWEREMIREGQRATTARGHAANRGEWVQP